MKFDLVLTNPPFQDRVNRGRTPHKLWIDFTLATHGRLLSEDGLLCQVSPSSFRSPSNRVLGLLKDHRTEWIDFDTARFFPDVASTFASYAVRRARRGGKATRIHTRDSSFELELNDDLFYLPSDLCEESLAVHQKVVFVPDEKLAVEHDYVTCHNILLRKGDTLSRDKTRSHVHPVFHTNRQVWWSSVKQEFASAQKVMWTRSGYTKPFFDDGEMGGTDMVYFVRVASAAEGECLAHNLNLKLMRYVFQSARWSGFGNERVFEALPALPVDRALSDEDMFGLFSLTRKEAAYVTECVG